MRRKFDHPARPRWASEVDRPWTNYLGLSDHAADMAPAHVDRPENDRRCPDCGALVLNPNLPCWTCTVPSREPAGPNLRW